MRSPVGLPTSFTGPGAAPPMQGPTVSPLASAIASRGQAMRPNTLGRATVRPPRVPIAGTLRNIDQVINKAKPKLGALGAKMQSPSGPAGARFGKSKQFDAGGKVGLSVRAISVLKDAISHLTNKDVSSAAAVLRSSPEAMSHPAVAQAAAGLRASTGIAPATKTLTGLVNADTDRTTMGTLSAQ